jgi:hypothetical protein
MTPSPMTPLGRAFALYRRTALSRSAIVLLVANAIPLVGVLFWGWSLLTILVIYWVENGIVGFWNVPKIATAQGSMLTTLPEMPESAALAAAGDPAGAASLRAAWEQARQARVRQIAGPGAGRMPAVSRSGLALFFLVHYGVFWLVHGIFVFALPTFGGGFGRSGTCLPSLDDVIPGGIQLPAGLPGIFAGETCAASPFGEVLWGSVAVAAIALFISHGASFVLNYIGRGEYLTASPGGQMARPYARVVVLHLTIIFGAFVVALLGSPIGALLVLVVLKTIFDLGLHLRERSHADARIPANTAYGRAIQGT